MGKCKTTLASIKNCAGKGNASGIVKRIYVSPRDHVATIPDPDAGTYDITAAITMEVDVRTDAEIDAGVPATPVAGVFFELDFKETGFNLTSEDEGDAEDGQVRYTLAGKIPRRSAASSYILESLRGGRELVVVLTDRNRFTSIMGDLTEGATATVRETTDGNGYDISITWLGGRLLYGYSAAVPTA